VGDDFGGCFNLNYVVDRPLMDEATQYSYLYLEEKLTQKEIAKRVGYSQQWISKLIKKHSIPVHHFWSTDEEEFLREHYRELPYKEIAEKLKRSPDSIKYKRLKMNLEPKQPFIPWKPFPLVELSYVLGVILGDGWVRCQRNPSNYTVGLNCNDKDFAEAFRTALQHIGLKPRMKFRGKQWVVWDCNKDFAEWSKSLSPPTIASFLVSNEMVKSFIRGFYDSEGSFEVTNKKQGHRGAVFYNSNLELLLLIQSLLRNMHICSVLVSHHSNCHKLGVYRQNEVKTFLSEIGSSIKRKRGEIG